MAFRADKIAILCTPFSLHPAALLIDPVDIPYTLPAMPISLLLANLH